MQTEQINNVVVIGAGAMGHGITQALAVCGHHVVMTDVQQSFLDKGVEKIRYNFDFLVNKGKMGAEDAGRILKSNIATSLDLGKAAAGAQLVIEAAPEIFDLKKKIFQEVSDHAPAEAILATNTSTMRITDIARAVSNPQRFIGMHFFNPADRMKLVEVVYGEETKDACADAICGIAEKMKKVPIRVLKDRPGFIVNRINAPNQALLNAILDEGQIVPDAVDNLMKKMGQPMGPFELADFVGLDVFCHTLEYYSQNLSADYRPGRFLKEKVEKNELGSKTGRGIYTWKEGKAQIDPSQSTTEISPMAFLSVQMNEAVRVFKEGIAKSTADIDQAIVHGMRAFAGPFAICAGISPQDLVQALETLKGRYGLEIFEPEPEIRDGAFKKMDEK